MLTRGCNLKAIKTNFIEHKFFSIYKFIDIIDGHVNAEVDFWNFNAEIFISSATTFQKDTLLHLYIVTTLLNYYHKEFYKNEDDLSELSDWCHIYLPDLDQSEFLKNVKRFLSDDDYENFDILEHLFDAMAKEAFYILFSNRNFLFKFNQLASETIKRWDESIFCSLKSKFDQFTPKGTIKRKNIPQWVKIAVFHRDKGLCVYCGKDLTGVFNNLLQANYDHMVPLDLFGANDPCNIQLTCCNCNQEKSNKDIPVSKLYVPWWS